MSNNRQRYLNIYKIQSPTKNHYNKNNENIKTKKQCEEIYNLKAQQSNFALKNNPFSQQPIQPTFSSEKPSRNSGGTARILDLERAKASFNVETMTNIIDGNRETTVRRRFFTKQIENLVDEGIESHFLDQHQIFLKMQKHFNVIHQPFLEKFKLKSQDVRLMQSGRVIGGGPGPHLGIFLGPIYSRGTSEQIEIFGKRGRELKIIGCYAQTELGHGSNVRGLETTARYDIMSRDFIINTPTLTSIKQQISNLGKLATHALVYAQLLIGEKEYGIHEFIVQIRDENHRPLPGIEVGYVGDCLGNLQCAYGFLRLENVRVPRDRMLARYQQVTEDGQYIKASIKKNPYTHYYTMLVTRSSIVRTAAQELSRAATIAIRYSAIRHQGFIDSSSKISYKSSENCLLDYSVQQYRLFKQLSTTYCFCFGGRYLSTMFANINDIASEINKIKQISATTSGLKAFTTTTAMEGIEDLRKCCGGHGYSKASGISTLLVDYMPNPTYEGDQVILYLQTARFLMKTLIKYNQNKVNKKDFKIEGSLKYLFDDEDMEIDENKNFYFLDNLSKEDQNVEMFLDPKFLHKLFQYRARRAVQSAYNMFCDDLNKKGLSQGEATRRNGISLLAASKSHSLTFLFEIFMKSVEQVNDEKCFFILRQLLLCFGLCQIVDFEKTLTFDSKKYENLALKALQKVLDMIRPNAVALVDAFDFTDASLKSVLGKRDGNVYEAIWESTKKAALNQVDPFIGYEEYLRPMLDLDLLKLGNSIKLDKMRILLSENEKLTSKM